MGGKLFQGGEPRPSCRQSRQAEAKTQSYRQREPIVGAALPFPFPVQKGAPIRRSYGSIRHQDKLAYVWKPAEWKRNLSFGQQPTESNFWEEEPARRIAAFVSIPHPKSCQPKELPVRGVRQCKESGQGGRLHLLVLCGAGGPSPLDRWVAVAPRNGGTFVGSGTGGRAHAARNDCVA